MYNYQKDSTSVTIRHPVWYGLSNCLLLNLNLTSVVVMRKTRCLKQWISVLIKKNDTITSILAEVDYNIWREHITLGNMG